MTESAVDHRVLLISDALKEVAVVGNHDERAGPRVQQVLHGREHVRVEVVRGLVKDKHVGLVQQDEQELQAAALASGEVLDGRGQLDAREAEAFKHLAGRHLLVARHVGGALAADHVGDAVVAVFGEFRELLRQGRDHHGLAALDAALGGFEFTCHELEQRGFASAVNAEHTRALARGDPPRDIAEYLVFVVGDGGVEDVHNVLAQSGRGHLLELDHVARWRLVSDQGVRGLDAELRLGRARGGSAAQPRELLAHEVLALGLGRGSHAVALHALQDVRRISALKRLDDAVVDLPRRGTDFVEEPAVVGDHEQAALVGRPALLQVASEPSDGLDVEVVGGLVECDDFPVADQKFGQGSAAALPTGQVTDSLVPVQVLREARKDVAHLGVGRPHVLGQVAYDRLAHVEFGVQVVSLGEHAEAHVRASGDATRVGLERAGKHLQKGGLAVAVAADDTNAVALVDTDCHGIKNDFGGELEVQRLSAK